MSHYLTDFLGNGTPCNCEPGLLGAAVQCTPVGGAMKQGERSEHRWSLTSRERSDRAPEIRRASWLLGGSVLVGSLCLGLSDGAS